MLPHLSVMPMSEAVFIYEIDLKDCPVIEQEAPCRILGDLLGRGGTVKDDLRQHVVRPSADPAVHVVADLPR